MKKKAKKILTSRARKKELTGINLNPIHQRLDRLEAWGVAVGKFLTELQRLLNKNL